MNLKRGKPLKKGDMIGVTAPASPVEEEKLQAAIEMIRQMGFSVKVGWTCYQHYGGYLAGSKETRAQELNQMFQDPSIDAIICLRGGYGSGQILNLLDYEMISQHPKLFVGYSDITALHIAFQQKSGLSTIHGPMPASDLITAGSFTFQSLLSVLQENDSFREIQNPPDERIGCLVPGVAEGVIIGGNLSVITSLLGTPYEIDTKGKILFLEEIGEEPYRIDRMFTQLALSGKFDDAVGIILGTWTNTEPKKKYSFHVEDLWQEIIAPFNKPTIYNVRAGHCEPMVTIPFGRKVRMDAANGNLILLE